MADHVGHWTAMSDNGKVPIADLVENYGGANDGFVLVPNSVCHLSTGLNNPVSPFARNGRWATVFGGVVAHKNCVFENSGNPFFSVPNRRCMTRPRYFLF